MKITLENFMLLLMASIGVYSFAIALYCTMGLEEFCMALALGMIGVCGSLFIIVNKA